MIRRSKMWASGLAAAMVLALSAAALPQFFTTGDAEAFTPPANSGYIAIDCDTVTAGIQDACTFPSGTTTVTVNVVIGNNLGFDTDIGAFNFEAIATPQTMLNPPVGTDADKNANPNFLEATVGAAGTWSCSPPAPSNDKDPSASVANSFLSCFESTGTTTALADGTFLPVASITYNTTNGADGLIRIQSVSVGDSFGTPYVDCGLLSDTDPCFDATIAIGSAATNTPTATNTTAPATNTPTATNTTAPATNTPTATNTTAPATNTPTATNTSEVPVATDTPTNTATNTPTATNTSEVPVATDTPTNTPTNTPTATNTSEVPATNTPTATNTSEVPATNTPTATNTSEAPATNTPSPTNTS
ncbi:MAG TPA: hypothetical protein VFH62_05030, partial [Dehalococcoidia bacterium]|nr:hypothetical protein [Dehalococcoidia bacterium]